MEKGCIFHHDRYNLYTMNAIKNLMTRTISQKERIHVAFEGHSSVWRLD